MEQWINNSPLPLVFLLLVVGFVLLIKGADFFVDGSSAVARRLRIPSIIIGLTIVAMGTSLPETAVSVTASIVGNNTLAVSNVTGSNIFNLMVVIGICAFLTPVMVKRETVTRDIPYSAICAGLLLLMGMVGIGDISGMVLGRLDGAVFLILFALYLVLMVKEALRARKQKPLSVSQTSAVAKDKNGKNGEDSDKTPIMSLPKSLIFIIAGAAAIAIGGDLTVDTASRIAVEFGMSQTLVGLTICSIGTSLPELVTSIVAARRNEVDMALGNAIGSNIFNILMVLGIAAVISPMDFLMENIIDIVVLLVFTLLVWVFAITKKRISKPEGTIMLILYAVYAVYICIR